MQYQYRLSGMRFLGRAKTNYITKHVYTIRFTFLIVRDLSFLVVLIVDGA